MITIKKNYFTIDNFAAITVVLIQVLIIYFMNDSSKFIFNFIEATFGTVRFGFIIPLVAVITYALYFGNSRLSFVVGFLSTITPQVYFILFLGGLDFVLKFPQSFIATFVLGVIFGLIGMLFSVFKKNADISTRILMHAAVLISLLGIPAIFGLWLDIGMSLMFWIVFNSALILLLLLSYLILRDVKKAFIFTFSALIIMFLMIIITLPYSAIFSPYPPIVYFLFGSIIAIILGAILKVYTYYRAHKTPR